MSLLDETAVNFQIVLTKTDKMKTWWRNAFKQGALRNGQVAYSGPISRTALPDGVASLTSKVEYVDAVLDYGYQRQWPVLSSPSGYLELAEGGLSIVAQDAKLGPDPVVESTVNINEVFKPSRYLTLVGSAKSTFVTTAQLILQGPLFEPEDRPETMPITPGAGEVDIWIDMQLPFADVTQVSLNGYADIRGVDFELTGGVPVKGIDTRVDFTERSAESEWMQVQFLGGEATAKLSTLEPGRPPVLGLEARGNLDVKTLEPWLGEHVLTQLEGGAAWQGSVVFDGSSVRVSGTSDLQGLAILTPQPLGKRAQESRTMTLDMRFGNTQMQQFIDVKLDDSAHLQMQQNPGESGSFFDAMLVSIGGLGGDNNRAGVHFDINASRLDLDAWMESIIDIASYEPKTPVSDTEFLDAMRTIRILSDNPLLFGRQFGTFELNASSDDGEYWFGRIDGERINGNLQFEPRSLVSQYRFDLENLYLDEAPDPVEDLPPIDESLSIASYPAVDLIIEDLRVEEMRLGRLVLSAAPLGEEWKLLDGSLSHKGIVTQFSGQWSNASDAGSLSSFSYQTDIQAAGEALDSMDFGGILKSGSGLAQGRLEWRGAPHEFDYSRLDGEFDIRIADGELVQVAPGSGRLLGLLNINTLLRRLTLDFSDVVASGLRFDRMRFKGLISEGRALMNEAYMLSPAAFVRMQGEVDMAQELVDMEFNIAPDLGGNLTLLSALANPAAGAVMFVIQNVFKEEMRNNSLISYRAKGGWDDFTFEQMVDGEPNGVVFGDDAPQPSEESAETVPTESVNEDQSSLERPSEAPLVLVEGQATENSINDAP